MEESLTPSFLDSFPFCSSADSGKSFSAFLEDNEAISSVSSGIPVASVEAHGCSLTTLSVVFVLDFENWLPENLRFGRLAVRCFGTTRNKNDFDRSNS